jgi:cytochrome c oxidase subunit 2
MKVSNILPWFIFASVNTLASVWMAGISHTWFPPVASIEAQLIDNLFAFLVFLGTFIFLGITGVLGYSVLTGLTSRFDTSDGPPIEGNVTLEIVWTAIPLALVVVIAGYSYWIYDQMAVRGPMEIVHMHMPGMETAYAAPLDGTMTGKSQSVEAIAVNAKQWSWAFHYPNSNITSSELHLPVNQRVHLALHTEDVIHGFYVPAFRLKQDIIPNKTIDFEFTPIREGTYRLSDSQFSGTYFAVMQTNVVVESAEKYSAWLSKTGDRALVPAANRAYEEYNQIPKNGFKPAWATIPPEPPPMVNEG